MKAGGGDRDEYNKAATDQWNTKSLVACPGCKRTFNPEALEKHIKGCAPGAAAK